MLGRPLRWARSGRLWALLGLFGLLAALGGRLLWAEYHLRAARRAVDRRAYAEARSHLDRYLSVWPRSAAAHLLGCRCAGSSGDFDEAERLLAAGERLGADREALDLEERLLDAQRGTLSPAGEAVLLSRVERGHPEAPRILEALALGCLYTNRPRDAMAYLERWLGYSPGDPQALYLRGLAWAGLGAPEKAGEDYRQAVRRDPEHLQARRRLADYLAYAGEYAQAAEHFEHLRARDPEDPAALLGLAHCRRLQGRADEARRLLAGLLRRDDPPVAALVEQARLEQEQADFRAAEECYRRALGLDPFDHEACYGLAQCLRALKRAKEAEVFEARAARVERDLKRLTALLEEMAGRPADPDLPCEAGTICLRNGQNDEARRWFRRALRLNPEHPGARRGLEQTRDP